MILTLAPELIITLHLPSLFAKKSKYKNNCLNHCGLNKYLCHGSLLLCTEKYGIEMALIQMYMRGI